MVEINNQRKAFLDTLAAWELITDVRKPETAVMTSGGELSLLRLLRSPSQTCHAKPKTQINRRRTLPASFRWWMPTASSLAWKTSLRKVRTLWHCSRLRSVALYLWLIVVISVRQSTVAATFRASPLGAGYIGSDMKASLTQNSKKWRNTREIDVWAESPRLSPLWLSASSSACRAVNHYRDNAITYKAQRQKCQRTGWRTRQLLTCRCVSVMLLRSMQNTRRS